MEELRDKVYDWTSELINEGKLLQGLILMLATWNFANFRYAMKTFPLDEFEKSLKKCDFDYFNDKNFEDTNLEDANIKSNVMRIYNELSKFKGVKYVGATKIMHFLCPKFFVMWDQKIREHYGFGTSAEEYYNFMNKMQTDYKEGKFKDLEKGVTIPRAIDISNLQFSDFKSE